MRAIIEAAVNVANDGCRVHPHIMIPLVALEDELLDQVKIVKDTAAEVMAALGKEVPIKVRCSNVFWLGKGRCLGGTPCGGKNIISRLWYTAEQLGVMTVSSLAIRQWLRAKRSLRLCA